MLVSHLGLDLCSEKQTHTQKVIRWSKHMLHGPTHTFKSCLIHHRHLQITPCLQAACKQTRLSTLSIHTSSTLRSYMQLVQYTETQCSKLKKTNTHMHQHLLQQKYFKITFKPTYFYIRNPIEYMCKFAFLQLFWQIWFRCWGWKPGIWKVTPIPL